VKYKIKEIRQFDGVVYEKMLLDGEDREKFYSGKTYGGIKALSDFVLHNRDKHRFIFEPEEIQDLIRGEVDLRKRKKEFITEKET
jgi:hypothetical protein